MGKLIGSIGEEVKRNQEPDYPGKRNPWDPNTHPENYKYIAKLIKIVDAMDTRPAKYPPEVKMKVYQLRDEGYTLREIAQKVKISKSTACLYLQNRSTDIPSETYEVKQPGTNTTRECEVTIREVNIGKIKASGPHKKVNEEA